MYFNTTRRDFLKAAGACVAGAALSREAHAAPERPNILLIMSDEHNASVMGCAGNSIANTPNLDRLAARGVFFENCYCNSPLCVPSRLSFTSGKYVSRVGAWNNDCWLPSDAYPSVARLLNGAQYESFLCGKMHYDRTRRYGFTEIGGEMNRSFKTGRGGRRKADDLEPVKGISERFDEFHTGENSSVLSHDRAVTTGVSAFLAERDAGASPFFLLAGYLAPHFPLIVPEAFWKKYEGKVPLPEIPEGYLETLPLNYKHLRIGFNMEDAPEEIVRRGRELYYALTEWVDTEIGKILSALDASPHGDNTVVIYTADHGENMGEHGLWWKNCLFNTAARVPLIVSWPARWAGGQRRTEVCSLVDVAATLAALAGTEAPPDWDGDSMLGWLDGEGGWKDRAVSEYYAHNIASGYVMYREGAYKYVYHCPPDETHPCERELYCLKDDRGELHNLAGDPGQQERIAAMHAALLAELGEAPDETEKRCRADYAKGYDRKERC